MSTAKARAAGAKGVLEFKPKISRGLPAGARLICADNTGAKVLRLINVAGYKSRLRRIPSACVGEMVKVSVVKGSPDLRKQILPAIVVRQRKPYRRSDGVWVQFEDNAAVLITPEGEMKGTEIRGPVAKEAAERWPRLAGIANIII
ncbi:MAG: 50S ribosomal protein L14 [Candidatus Bathyarchaeia archaeon]